MIIRVCAAIIRDDEILMVFHQGASRSYWTLPGGGVEEGETPLQAVVREVEEETGLRVQVVRPLFDDPFSTGQCRCFLVRGDDNQEAVLGYDPEEVHLERHKRMLQGVAWHSLESMKDDGQVAKVINCLAQTDWQRDDL